MGSDELRSLTDSAYEKIKDSILDGTLRPGTRLSDRYLSEEMGVSTTTVKRALNMLSIEGLVEIRPRKGTFVIESYSERMEENTVIRAAMDGVIARLAAEKAKAKDLEAMRIQLEYMKKCASEGTRRDRIEANAVFHEMVRDIADNPHIMRLIGMMHTFDVQLRINAQSSQEESLRAWKEHEDIYMAIKNREGEKAEVLMKDHVLRSLQFVMNDKKS